VREHYRRVLRVVISVFIFPSAVSMAAIRVWEFEVISMNESRIFLGLPFYILGVIIDERIAFPVGCPSHLAP
jgi:hypothetical protein